jgi:AcrR family transcriptional regulator
MSVLENTSPQAGARREALLEAALEVIARKGFHHTSIADIAARARASRATVYLYFRDKRDILAAIARRVEEGIIAAIDAWVPLPESPSRPLPPALLVEQLQRMIDARIAQGLDAIRANADAARLVLRLERGHDDVADATRHRIDAHIVGAITRDVERAIGNGWARRCDAPMTARYLFGGIQKLVADALDDERPMTVDVPAIAREIGTLMFFGLAHPDLLRHVAGA